MTNEMPYLPRSKWQREPESPRDNYIVILIALILAGIIIFGVKTARADIVSVAQSQIGLGEIEANNRGIYVRQYLGGRENLPWCAGFVSYCAKQSGYKTSYTLRAKDYLKLGYQVSNPKPGDIIVLTRQGGGHTGIVEKVTANAITTIEGNLGEYPAKVKRVTYKGKIKNLVAFVRLQKG